MVDWIELEGEERVPVLFLVRPGEKVVESFGSDGGEEVSLGFSFFFQVNEVRSIALVTDEMSGCVDDAIGSLRRGEKSWRPRLGSSRLMILRTREWTFSSFLCGVALRRRKEGRKR